MSDTDSTPFSRPRGPRRADPAAEVPTSRARAPIGERLDRASEAYEKAAKPFLVLLFIFLLIMPVFFQLGPVLLTFPRLFLLIMFVPLIFRWLTGRHGGILVPDLLLVGHSLWHFFIITFHHGFSKASEFSTIAAVELLGAYFLARVYIRDRSSFVFFLRCAFWTLAALLPFAMIESLTRATILPDLIGAIPGLQAFEYVDYEPRLGLFRAQATFEHPILFGVICSALFGTSWFTLAKTDAGIFARGMRTIVPFLGTVFSLSSGALVAIMVQLMLIGWDFLTKTVNKRWNILALIFLALYVGLDVLSNRSPAQIFISFATFSSSTGFNRLLIWEYGSAEVIRHPIFGLGLKDWIRAPWMAASTDNYWLLVAMRFGLPGFILMAAAFFMAMRGVAKMDFSDRPELQACQKGYLITLIGVFIAMGTVHMWGGTYLFVVFFLASGIWMFTMDESTGPRRGGGATREADTSDKRSAAPERRERGGGSRRRNAPSRRGE